MRNPKKGKGKKKELKPPQAVGNSSKAAAAVAQPSTPAVWRAGQDPLEEGEDLQYDPSAYDCLHPFRLDWPCLSFDVLADGLGAPRAAFPHTLFLAAGTQAAAAKANSLALVRLSNLGQGRHGKRAAAAEEDDDMSDSDEDEEPAELALRSIAHPGGVNRLRSMPQQPGVIATWADSGQVLVWDATALLAELAQQAAGNAASARPARMQPRHAQPHVAEGFALDWSRVAAGRLATGDCRRHLHVWQPAEGGRWRVSGAYEGHSASVEDVQWSPTEDSVLASCSVDRSIRIWDTRCRERAQLAVPAHEADVNVISWNRLASHTLASGGDDGVLRVWDLRNFAEGAYVANFTYHRGAITSLEWSPSESSVVATAGAEGQLGVWDLALERDPEEEAALAADSNAAAPSDLPPQLLFVHSGQTDMKELHWHAQIPGMLISTAADSFNVFRPSNL